MDEQPIWRQALKDSKHPLNQATWLLFHEEMDVKGAAKLLAAQRQQVIDYLYLILDTDDLYLTSSLGTGSAPINAVLLLCEWRVVDALPRLLKILASDIYETTVWDDTALALIAWGAEIVPPLLAAAAQTDDKELHMAVASIVCDAGRGQDVVFHWLSGLMELLKSDFDLEIAAEYLLMADKDRAIPFLHDKITAGSYSKGVRRRLGALIEMAKKGEFDDDAAADD